MTHWCCDSMVYQTSISYPGVALVRHALDFDGKSFRERRSDLSRTDEVTQLLHEWSDGTPDALDRLFDVVYPQLRQIAGALFRGEAPEHLLQPTIIVNELFLKLVRQRSLRFEDRQHFYSLSARLMRRVLMDHARSEGRQKRGSGGSVPLDEKLAWIGADSVELLDLERVLDELNQPGSAQMPDGRATFFSWLLGRGNG